MGPENLDVVAELANVLGQLHRQRTLVVVGAEVGVFGLHARDGLSLAIVLLQCKADRIRKIASELGLTARVYVVAVVLGEAHLAVAKFPGLLPDELCDVLLRWVSQAVRVPRWS